MEKKQTAVDWLVEEINKQKAWADSSKLEPIIKQAKQMHREETEHFGAKCCMMTLQKNQWSLEQLYNETFGGTK
jgi:hypothetical protein